MKKPKLNIDKEALQRFFLEHSEKLIFGAAVIGAGIIAFLAVSKASYDETPERLQQQANVAKKHIAATNWEDVIEDYCRVPDYVVAVKQSRTPIDAALYALDKPFAPLIFRSKEKRGLPANLLPVEDLRVAAGREAFMVSKEERRGFCWVVITGVLKEEAQKAFFIEYYRETQRHNKQTDVAQYTGYEVQRAEVAGSIAAGGLQWQNLNVVEAVQEIKDLDSENKKGSEDLNLVTACPSPPRLEGSWDKKIVSHPSLEPKKKSSDKDGKSRDKRRKDGDPSTDDSDASADNAEPKLKLFRFFDLSAESGKTYRYRVRLLLKNPNEGVAVQYLKDDDYSAHIPDWQEFSPATAAPAAAPGAAPGAAQAAAPAPTAGAAELSASETICTDWSAESPDVFTPRDWRLLAVTVSPPAPGLESNPPVGKVMVINWAFDEEENVYYGIEAYRDFSVLRGKVVNFKNYKFPEDREPKEEKKKKKKDEKQPRYTRRPQEIEQIEVHYMTESLVVDLRPGQRSSSKDPWPGPSDILVMNSDGSLSVLNELADRADYWKRTMGQDEIEEKTEKKGTGTGGAPELPDY